MAELHPESVDTLSVAPWPVAVFAHNEASRIVRCLDALQSAESHHPLSVYILANGCTDRTEEIVRDYSRNHPFVHLVSIDRGDKANAWNIYVHEIAHNAEIHFFTDGDVEVCPGALLALHHCLAKHPIGNAASALPRTGRNAEAMRKEVVTERGIMGNLYAIRGTFLDRLRQYHVRLPIGFIGEDGLVGALIKWDLAPGHYWDSSRVLPCDQAFFEFRSLALWKPTHWYLYFKRMTRYSLRTYQFAMLAPQLKRRGIDAMPRFVSELYTGQHVGLRWRGASTLFDYFALRQLQKHWTHFENDKNDTWSDFRLE